MSYLTVESWNEPRAMFDNESDFDPMMSKEEHGFLCAMLKAKCTDKIIELGVAAGGTTAVIMEALKLLNRDSKVYSVDLSKEFYVDVSYRTGYLYDMYKNQIGNSAQHSFLLGKTITEQIEKIAKGGIGFAVLDTAHFLPGEMLDFLCLLPYLEDGAIIVLHDIMASTNCSGALKEKKVGITGPYRCICTQLLFSLVRGRKFFNFETPNIAAFEVNTETRKNIVDIFMALDITWGELPQWSTIQKYERIFEKYYDSYCLELFRKAVRDNKATHMRIRAFLIEKTKQLENYIEKESIKRIGVWGVGAVGRETIKKLQLYDIEIVGTVDINGNQYEGLEMYKTYKELPDCDLLLLTFRYDEIIDVELKREGIRFSWINDIVSLF